MDITQPEFIPVPWAANGQKASIPEEQTSAGNGRASWKTGFPTENTLPISQGGVPANYQDFQGVLYSLSENVCYQQAGGMFTWSATIDYQNGARVLGSDGKAYISTGKTGPSTTVVNPVGDTSGKWLLDANMNQVSSAASAITQDYVTSGGYTVSGDVTYGGDVTVSGTVNGGGIVHLVGNETISGTKTFSSTISGNITGSASYATSAGQATKLTTARTVQTNLANTSAASFNGTANITPGVTGTLAVANGGTGVTTIADIQAGKDGAGNTITDTYVEQTVYEAAIENLDETKAGKDTVAVNTKSIANLQSLLNGALSTTQTDSTAAYSKTVPAGAQPWAKVQEVGGRTVVWNQICKNGDFDGTTSWSATGNNGTISASNNELAYTVVNAGTGYAYGIHQTSIQNIANTHKIFIMADIKSNASIVIGYDAFNNANNNWGTLTTAYQTFSTIVSVSNSSTVYFCTRGGATAGDVIYFKKVRFVNLTLLYGAGNEPSTVAEFTAMFPTIDPAYNAGQLISAAVTEAVSVGRNLADISGGLGEPSDTAMSNTTKRTFVLGKYVKGFANNNYYQPTVVTVAEGTSGTIQVSNTTAYYGFGVPFNCEAGATYHSATVVSGTAVTYGFMWYAQDGTYISYESAATSVAPANAAQGVFLAYSTAASNTITLSNIQIEKGSTATPYTKPFTATLPIPSAVRNLPGYGWSAGSAYNYIDWERKVYIQRVGSVDLGTLTWGTDGTGTAGKTRFVADVTGSRQSDTSQIYTIISNGWPLLGNGGTYAPNEGYTIGWNARIYYFDESKMAYTAEQFKASMSGVKLNYALSTPVETDISSLLSDDNLLQVEPGGTLTFLSVLGDSYRIPVPSGVEYTIDLAPDTPSTDGTYTLQCVVADGVATYSWVSE